MKSRRNLKSKRYTKNKRQFKNKRYTKNKRYLKSRKGGFFKFFSNKPKVVPSECDQNKLSMLKDSKSMHANYQTCCPKNWMGKKNSSPYCKQLDLNFNAAIKGANINAGVYGTSDEVAELSKKPEFFNQTPILNQQPALNQQGLKENINNYEV